MSPYPIVAPQRRAEILDATVRLLARDGLPGLTMKALAKESGFHQGSLHYYFPNKRAILEGAVDRVMRALHQRVAAKTGDARDPRQRLRAIIKACLGTAEEQSEFWTVLMQFWSAMVYDGHFRSTNAAQYASLRRLIGRIVRAGIHSGDFRPVTPERAGAVILALVDGLSLQRDFDRKALSFPEAVRLCEIAVFRFLAPKGSRPSSSKGGRRERTR